MWQCYIANSYTRILYFYFLHTHISDTEISETDRTSETHRRSQVETKPAAHCSALVRVPVFTTHTRLTALFPGLPGCAGTRKVKPIWILLKQETVSGSGISWAPHSRQITTPAPHHSVFYRPYALPAAQPTASKH